MFSLGMRQGWKLMFGRALTVAAATVMAVAAPAAASAPQQQAPQAAVTGVAPQAAVTGVAPRDRELARCRVWFARDGVTVVEGHWWAVKGGKSRYATWRVLPLYKWGGGAWPLGAVIVRQGRSAYWQGVAKSGRLNLPRTRNGSWTSIDVTYGQSKTWKTHRCYLESWK